MRVPIVEGGREVSHLEASIARPARGPVSARVLYLHGFGSSQSGEKADFFRGRATGAGLEFWSFDFQGHGSSGGSMHDLSLTRSLGDIARVREEMASHEPLPLVLLGSSMGGLCGLWHSARHPEELAAGLYIAPALGLEETFHRFVGADGLARWEREGVFQIANERGSWDLGWGFVEDLRGYPNEALAASLRTPSQLLQGKLDDRVDWRGVLELATGCEGSGVEMHLFADGDHRLVDRKEYLWTLMRGFLCSRKVLE